MNYYKRFELVQKLISNNKRFKSGKKCQIHLHIFSSKTFSELLSGMNIIKELYIWNESDQFCNTYSGDIQILIEICIL